MKYLFLGNYSANKYILKYSSSTIFSSQLKNPSILIPPSQTDTYHNHLYEDKILNIVQQNWTEAEVFTKTPWLTWHDRDKQFLPCNSLSFSKSEGKS